MDVVRSAGSAPGCVRSGISEPTPTTTRRHPWLAADGLDQRALFRRVVHDRAHAPEDRAEQPQPDGRVALGRRHEHGLLGHRARAVVGVVVAVAEEQDVVELVADPGDVSMQRRARRPLAVEPAQFVLRGSEARRTPVRPRAEVPQVALATTGKRRTGTPFTRSTPGRQLVTPGDVVARARGEDFDLRVPRQAFGDVARVQFGAAVDVGAVALDDDRELHCSGPSVRRVRRRRRRRPSSRRRSGRRSRLGIRPSQRRLAGACRRRLRAPSIARAAASGPARSARSARRRGRRRRRRRACPTRRPAGLGRTRRPPTWLTLACRRTGRGPAGPQDLQDGG